MAMQIAELDEAITGQNGENWNVVHMHLFFCQKLSVLVYDPNGHSNSGLVLEISLNGLDRNLYGPEKYLSF